MGLHRSILAALPVCLALGVAGCGRPHAANIELRKQNAELRGTLEVRERTIEGLRTSIHALESQATTVPVLPQDRVDVLFTTHGLQLGRLTGGWDRDRDAPGHEGIKVYAVPTDESGEVLKAAGSFTIRLFDLQADADELLLGEWTFTPEQARDHWLGRFTLYDYVFELPWQQAPRDADLLVRVSFTDALTQRTFTAQKEITIDLPPAPTTDTRAAGQ